MPESFDALAVDIARFQCSHIEGYARLVRARGLSPDALHTAAEFPATPADAFKVSRVFAFPESEATATFRTSGTTIGQRGEHFMRTTATYDAAAIAFGRWALMHDLALPVRMAVLGPSPTESPDSSLTHMIAAFFSSFGEPSSDSPYIIEGDVIDLARLDAIVATLLVDSDRPLFLFGTSFAFVHLLDALGDQPFPLPSKSRVMLTGGTKGKSREVSASDLRQSLAGAFAIDAQAIVSEYGMTELSSQFYETTLRDPNAPHGLYAEPPWARVVPVDPDTLAPVAEGDVGIARIEDLMNIDSAFAVLTADRVRRVPGGFELLGRTPGAAPRGCSIAIDELLGR